MKDNDYYDMMICNARKNGICEPLIKSFFGSLVIIYFSCLFLSSFVFWVIFCVLVFEYGILVAF